jgi:hypothetical protein
MFDYDLFNGLFAFEYTVEEPFKGDMLIYVQILDSEPYYNETRDTGLYTEEELANIDYGDDRYVDIPESPFTIFMSDADVSLYDTYEDILQAGLSHSHYSTIE